VEERLACHTEQPDLTSIRTLTQPGREIEYATTRSRIVESKKINAMLTTSYNHKNQEKCFRRLMHEFPPIFRDRLTKIVSLMLVLLPHRRQQKLRKHFSFHGYNRANDAVS